MNSMDIDKFERYHRDPVRIRLLQEAGHLVQSAPHKGQIVGGKFVSIMEEPYQSLLDKIHKELEDYEAREYGESDEFSKYVNRMKDEFIHREVELRMNWVLKQSRFIEEKLFETYNEPTHFQGTGIKLIEFCNCKSFAGVTETDYLEKPNQQICNICNKPRIK